MNLKLSRTALRELTRLYRGVLIAAMISAAFVASGAKADDGYNLVDGDNIVLDTNKTITNTVDTETGSGAGRKTAILAAGTSSISTGENTLTVTSSGAGARNYIFNTDTDNTDFTFTGNLDATITGTGSEDNRGLRQNATATETTWDGNIKASVTSENGNAITVDIWDGSTATFKGELTDISSKVTGTGTYAYAVQNHSSEGSVVNLNADQTNLTAEGGSWAIGTAIHQGTVNLNGNANITAKNGATGTRAIALEGDAGNVYDTRMSVTGETVNVKAESDVKSATGIFSSGLPATFESEAENLNINATSTVSGVTGIQVQYDANVLLKEGTNTTINANGKTYAYGVISQEYAGGVGNFTSHGDLTVNATSESAGFGVAVTEGASLTADQVTSTGTATADGGFGIGAFVDDSTATIGSAGKTSYLKGVATGDTGTAIGILVQQSDTGNSSATLKGTMTAEGAAFGISNSGTITNEANLTVKGGIENEGTFINNATIVSDNSLYNGDDGVFTNNGGLTISGIEDTAIFNTGVIASGENSTYTLKNNGGEGVDGGAIYNEGSVTLGDGVVLEGNKADNGGAIFNKGTLTIGDNATFLNNDLVADSGDGADIYNNGGSLVIGDGLTVTHTGDRVGDCNIYSDNGGSVEIGDNATFNGGGDAIVTTGPTANRATLTIGDNANFKDFDDAAIIAWSNTDATIGKNATFDNTGLAIQNSRNSATTVDDGFVVKNAGNENWGAVLNRANDGGDGTTTLEFLGKATFKDNTNSALYQRLGAIATFDGETTFENNSTTGNGGAIRNVDGTSTYHSTVTFNDKVTFTDNTAAQGGAIYNALNGDITFKDDATFANNTDGTGANDIYNLGTINLTAGADETLTLTLDGGIDGNGTINVNGAGTAAVDGAIKNQAVAVTTGELHLKNGAADGSNLEGSTVTVASGATINTIDETINDYTGAITLANGANIKGDINFESGKADTYTSTGAASVNYKVGNLVGAVAKGEQLIQVASDGTTVNKDGAYAWFNAADGLVLESSGNADGKVKITGLAGGIEEAADASASVPTIDYDFKADESINTPKAFQDNFNLNGDGASTLTLNADVTVTSGAVLNAKDMIFDGTGTMKTARGSETHVKDSEFFVDIENNGIWVSDPTTYWGTVTNNTTASYDNDTFETTSALVNNDTAYFENDVTFKGTSITGQGDLFLASGTTAFQTTGGTINDNDIYLASGAKFSGKIVGGSFDSLNNAIDTGLGTIENADLYIDANLSGTGSADAFAGTDGSTIKEIIILGNDYNAGTDELKIAVGGATLDSNVAIYGANYYTSVTKDSSGNLVFSDKLINTSTLRGTGDGSTTFVGDVVIGDKADTTTIGTTNVNIALDETNKTVDIISGAMGDGAHIGVDTKTSKKAELEAQHTVGTDVYTVGVKANANSKQVEMSADYNSTKTAIVRTSADSTGSKVEAIADAVDVDGKFRVVDGSTELFSVDGTSGAVVAKGVTADSLTIGSTTYGITSAGAGSLASLTVGGENVLTAGDVGPAYTGSTLADATTYVTTNGTKIANVATTAGLVTTLLNDKQAWVSQEFGYDTTTTDAATILGAANFVDQTGEGDVGLIDASLQLHGVLGDAQTTAATTGILSGQKIGDDITVVDAIDTVARNSVSLSADNTFTGLNTFKNDGGIAIQDGTGANSTRLKATADGLSVDRNVEATGFKIAGQAPVVTSIDVDGTGVTSAAAAANIMATAATVYQGAENGIYTGTKVNGDTTTTHTINSAIAKTNATLNNVLTTAGTEIDSAKVDVQWNSTDSNLATVLGNGTYTSTTTVAAGDSVTTAVSKLDTAVDTINTNIGTLSSLTTTDKSSLVNAVNEVAGEVSGISDIIGTPQTANATSGILTGYAINGNGTATDKTLVDAVDYVAHNAAGLSLNNTFSGNNTFTGTTQFNGATNTFGATPGSQVIIDNLGDLTVDKNLVIGSANAITSTSAGILNMGGNDLTGIKDLTTTGDATIGGDASVGGDLGVTGDASVGGDLDVTGTATVGALAIGTTGYGVTSLGAATFAGTNVASLDIGTTGAGFDASGNATTGTLTIGGANAISGTAGTLNMGGNDLTGIKDLTTTGDATIGGDASVGGDLGVTGDAVVGGDFAVVGDTDLADTTVTGTLTVTDGTNAFAMQSKAVTVDGAGANVLEVAGDVLSTGTVYSDGLTVTTATGTDTYTTVFNVDNTGSITSDMFTTNAGADTITIGSATTGATATDVLGTLSLNSGTDVADSIDATGLARSAAGTATTLTTQTSVVATIAAQAEDATYTNTIATGSNVTATTLGGAIGDLDAAIGNRTITSANAAIDTALATDVSTAISTIGDKIGTGTYTSANNLTSATTDITTAISDLDAVIGNFAAIPNTNGNLGGADVSADLDNLDVAIGDRSTLSTTNGHLTTTGDIVTNLNALDGAIGNTTFTGTNAAGSADLTVATNALDAAIGDVSQFSSGRYVKSATNTSDAIMALDEHLDMTEERVRRVEKEMRGGIASMAAMSALVPNARAAGDTQLAVGVGAYRDHQGIAVGGFHYFNDNILANVGASYGGDKSTVFRAGVTFGW